MLWQCGQAGSLIDSGGSAYSQGITQPRSRDDPGVTVIADHHTFGRVDVPERSPKLDPSLIFVPHGEDAAANGTPELLGAHGATWPSGTSW